MNQPTILIVESDLLVRHPLAQFLRECEYRVLEAATEGEARRLLAGSQHRIDLALVALDVPDQGGFALATWIRETHPSIQVILAGTVARTVEKAAELCDQGPAVAKPYDHQLVLDQIRRLQAARDRNLSSGADR